MCIRSAAFACGTPFNCPLFSCIRLLNSAHSIHTKKREVVAGSVRLIISFSHANDCVIFLPKRFENFVDNRLKAATRD